MRAVLPLRAIRRCAALFLGVAALGIATASTATAQTDDRRNDDDSQVVLNGRLVVPSGETDSAAVLFHGTADIAGTVTGALVVFDGDVTISGTVGEDVIVFNGDVTVQSGASVGGDIISRRDPQIADGATVRGDVRGVSGAYDLVDGWWWSRFAWWAAYTVSTLILGLLVLLVAPDLDRAIVERALARIGGSFGFGALFFFVLPIAAALLLVTIVGFPLGLFVLAALALIYTVGYVAGAHTLGRVIVKPPRSRYVAFLVGWGILRVVALVPVLGGLSWFATTVFGLGALYIASRTPVRTDPGSIRPDTGQPVHV